jgi:hypothetical protein
MRTTTLIVLVTGFLTIGAFLVCQNEMSRNERLLETYSQPSPMAKAALQAQYQAEAAETKADQN